MPEDWHGEMAAVKKELAEVKSSLARIEGMLAERCEARSQRIVTLEKDVDVLFSKVNNLNVTMAKWAGAATLLAVALNWILKGLGIEK